MAAQQQQQSDSAYDILYILVLVFAVAYGTWYFFHEQIVYFVFKLKLYQAQIVDLVTDDLDYNMELLQALEPSSVTVKALHQLAREVGYYFRFPIMLILGALAYLIYNKSIATKYKTKYSMNTLAIAEKINWPQITPVLKQELVKQDIMKGPWSMSYTPMEFAKKLELITVTPIESIGSQKVPPKVELIKPKAREVFVKQLGPLWTDIKDIPPYAKALFGIFAARINRNSGDADKMIRQLAISSGTPKMDYTGTDELIKKYYNTKLVQKVLDKHAYYLTVMSSMLAVAREDGVVASADFLWLKPIDRRLWYVLNTIGRQTPFTEISGVFAHWVAERTYGDKIKTPMVDTAVDALEYALSEIVYTEDEE